MFCKRTRQRDTTSDFNFVHTKLLCQSFIANTKTPSEYKCIQRAFLRGATSYHTIITDYALISQKTVCGNGQIRCDLLHSITHSQMCFI